MSRLLVDMNLSCEWIPLLRAAGHEAVHWLEVGDPRAPDVVLMQWASVRGYAESLVLLVLSRYAREIEQGALVVADERRQQVRILPLRQSE
jgi:hypothetical protein